jgi:hypothetical protein
MCKHYTSSNAGNCSICSGEQRSRYRDALAKIVTRLKDTDIVDLPELFKDIFQIASKALKD